MISLGSRFASGDLLHHWDISVGIFSSERSSVDFKKQPDGEERGSLVAVWQRVVAS